MSKESIQNSVVSNQELIERINSYKWYHKIELPGGIVTPGWSPICAERYCIPDDLTGLRVLDIGAWDGYWTFEALKRGAAEVVAIDDFSDTCGNPEFANRKGWETFDICRESFGFTKSTDKGFIDTWCNEKEQIVTRIEMSIYDIGLLGKFDIVFFFGTIYHLKHPLLALEKISQVCDGSIYIETACCDDYSVYNKNNKGFNQNEFVMEFYPFDEFANNKSNWWVPTLQCLGAMLESVGFKEVDCWALTDSPKQLCECRGFASGTKDIESYPVNKPDDCKININTNKPKSQKVAAVMSVPRLGFQDNMFCCLEGLVPLRIPIYKVQGAFWGQCLERGMQAKIDEGTDLLITIDYDTVFTKKDVEMLIDLMVRYPEASAIIPVQAKRGGGKPLMTIKGLGGLVKKDVPLAEFGNEITKIATGHFGLTILRVKDLLEIPHPWFKSEPDYDGNWGDGKVDDDIYFWKLMEKYKKNVYSANRVTVGHLELVATWPDPQGNTLYQQTDNYRKHGKPKQAWK
jgi:tRNA (mo5U34)-methyltransferase